MTWERITCEERERIFHAAHLVPIASRTDLGGEYGDPEVYTEWGTADETPVLRDWRFPGLPPTDERPVPDLRPCEHRVYRP